MCDLLRRFGRAYSNNTPAIPPGGLFSRNWEGLSHGGLQKQKWGFPNFSNKKIKEGEGGHKNRMPTRYMGQMYYHPEDMAKMLGVSIKTIYTYIKAGKIRGIKTLHKWWILEEDAEDFLQKRQGTKPPPRRPGQGPL